MRSPRIAIRTLLGVAMVLSLGACVSLLPKSKPSQLYRFGGAPAAAQAPAPGPSAGPGVVLVGVDFPRAAAGDGILTLTGDQAAYIGESRWVAPATVLFQEAAERAFDHPGARVRLLNRGDIGAAAVLLRLDVRDFQAVYDQGAAAAPEVVVSAYARMTGGDGRLIEARTYTSHKRAADNRVGAIVRAFDEATAEVLGAIVTVTEQEALAAPPRPVPGAATTVRRAP